MLTDHLLKSVVLKAGQDILYMPLDTLSESALLKNVYTYKEFDSGLYSAHDGITCIIMQ